MKKAKAHKLRPRGNRSVVMDVDVVAREGGAANADSSLSLAPGRSSFSVGSVVDEVCAGVEPQHEVAEASELSAKAVVPEIQNVCRIATAVVSGIGEEVKGQDGQTSCQKVTAVARGFDVTMVPDTVSSTVLCDRGHGVLAQG